MWFIQQGTCPGGHHSSIIKPLTSSLMFGHWQLGSSLPPRLPWAPLWAGGEGVVCGIFWPDGERASTMRAGSLLDLQAREACLCFRQTSGVEGPVPPKVRALGHSLELTELLKSLSPACLFPHEQLQTYFCPPLYLLFMSPK